MSNEEKIFKIIIAEDDEDDYALISDSFKLIQKNCQTDWVRDGEELLDFLNSTIDPNGIKKEKPDLIFLDLNMPKKDGREVLQEIKSNPKFKFIPVIILTTSQAKVDIQMTYNLGANSYIQKPFKYSDFHIMMENCFKYWIQTVKLPS
ncbi:MAG: response regulator [Nitrospinota bacterium]